MSQAAILLVEDNADDEALAMEVLTGEGLRNQVRIARDGQEALDFLFEDVLLGLPRIVLLDLKLPKVSGLDVLRSIKADPKTSVLPVVIFTSSRMERDRVDAYRLGANSYVYKPVEFARFTLAVKQIADYWLYWNEAIASRLGAAGVVISDQEA